MEKNGGFRLFETSVNGNVRDVCIHDVSLYQRIGPNKSKKLTRLIAPVHNIPGKVWMKSIIHMASQHRQQD